jgi:hypothetical protein
MELLVVLEAELVAVNQDFLFHHTTRQYQEQVVVMEMLKVIFQV